MIIRQIIPAQISALADDEVEVVLSTASLARDGNILIPQGANLDAYRSNPIVLWQHDPEMPVANAEDIQVANDKLTARIRFAPAGVSAKADEIRGLVKAGVVRAVSIGFEVIDGEPLDAKKPRGGQRVGNWELIECSFVSVPADTGAIVTARAASEADWKVGASKDMPIEDSDAWDGAAAEKSIFDHAGGDDFEPAKARKGFLVYDAVKPKERGSYKLPIAHVVDGELKVPKGAIKAAASRLPQTDIPDDVKKGAQAVIDHYKEKAGMDKKDGRSAPKTKRVRSKTRLAAPKFARGLYDVAQLAYALEQIGWILDCAKWEAEVEGDASKLPAMLSQSLISLGDALNEMTQEEVAELIAGKGVDEEGDAMLGDEERAHIAQAKEPHVRAFRRGVVYAKLRAGKMLSAETVRCMRSIQDQLDTASDHHRAGIKAHKEANAMVDDLLDRAGANDPAADQVVQKSDGTATDEGSRAVDLKGNTVGFRKRQAEKLRLAGVSHTH